MASVFEEKEEEFSIESTVPEERKAARKHRVQRRLEAFAKQKAVEDGTYQEPVPKSTLIEEAIENCQDTLRELCLEGKEMVSNIMVASDSNEVKRREIEALEKGNRYEKLREESSIAMEKLEELSERWDMIMLTSGPLELHQHMKTQKAKCLELIEQKNELIKDFQRELRLADEKFMKHRKTMYDELSLLTKRIDEMVLVMRKAYRIEMNKIEEAVDVTRTQLVDKHQKTWLSLYNEREKRETDNIERKFSMVEKFHDELRTIHVNHEEKYREVRIQLENDIQVLEEELERIKVLCLMNSEKLDYNYQVLKKREEENVYIKNDQKRRMNKLQDLVNTLKKKIDDKKQASDEEFKRLIKEVERHHKNVIETEKKAKLFSKLNNNRFLSIWKMKEREANELMRKIFAVDMIIYEQILGTQWNAPTSQRVKKKDLLSYKMAITFLKDQKKSKEAENRKRHSKVQQQKEAEMTPEVFEGSRRLLRHILELIADQSGFLMEEKLDRLLQPYSEDEQTLVRLDNVFTAIGIRTDKDIQTIRKAFLPYTICLLCEKMSGSILSLDYLEMYNRVRHGTRQQSVLQIRELEEKVSKLRLQAKGDQEVVEEVTEGSMSKQQDKESTDYKKGSRDYSDGNTESSSTKRDIRSSKRTSYETFYQPKKNQCDFTHPLIIEKHNVLKALRRFITSFHSGRVRVLTGIQSKLERKRFTLSRLLTDGDVMSFWEKYTDLFPPGMLDIWNALHNGLLEYLTLLQERHKLNMRAQSLLKQNLELKKLLSLYKPTVYKNLPAIVSTPKDTLDEKQLESLANQLP